MSDYLSRGKLRTRYVFTGNLVLDTALHVGGGQNTTGVSDSPVVRDTLGRPYIPGSSFKGAFRAAVERLVPHLLNHRTCALVPGYPDCMTTDQGDPNTEDDAPEQLSLDEAYREISSRVGRRLEGDAVKRALTRLDRPDLYRAVAADDLLLELLDRWLCDTCKVFGSPHLAATARFSDLPVEEPWYDLIQVRDGVGIDRDSDRARDRIKYNYETVPPDTTFAFNLTLENPSPDDLGLVAIGLQEFTQGMVPLGGIRSRGLGRCHLGNLKFWSVDFQDLTALKNYLLRGATGSEDEVESPCLSDWIEALLT